eukprot:snap_masked-scaffold_65-processed-gene-0.31-mRNA-1 protein AED:1.00 eAED:1.00 QI:0/-1/0/0/-1/1/1/0/77
MKKYLSRIIITATETDNIAKRSYNPCITNSFNRIFLTVKKLIAFMKTISLQIGKGSSERSEKKQEENKITNQEIYNM